MERKTYFCLSKVQGNYNHHVKLPLQNQVEQVFKRVKSLPLHLSFMSCTTNTNTICVANNLTPTFGQTKP